MTHAFFKALLFLAAGAVILALHHEQDIRKMGGLWKSHRRVGWLFLIGCLSIAGIPPSQDFFPKMKSCGLPMPMAGSGCSWSGR